MSSGRDRGVGRFEAGLVLLLMGLAFLWYASPQILYSLYPLYDILQSIRH
jgi:hypothetical protein